jgi:hypothetical protein
MRKGIYKFGRRKGRELMIEEVSWQLKSRKLWLEDGDTNIKIFHK